MKILLLILIIAFAQGCAGMADVWPRCRHEYTGYTIRENGDIDRHFTEVCE